MFKLIAIYLLSDYSYWKVLRAGLTPKDIGKITTTVNDYILVGLSGERYKL